MVPASNWRLPDSNRGVDFRNQNKEPEEGTITSSSSSAKNTVIFVDNVSVAVSVMSLCCAIRWAVLYYIKILLRKLEYQLYILQFFFKKKFAIPF